jgi:predicted secreted protein
MGAEHGQKVLLYIGDGGAVTLTGTNFSLVALTTGVALHRAVAITGAAVGQAVHVSGFADNPSFHAIIESLDADDLYLGNVVDDEGNALILEAEAAGEEVTVKLESFAKLKGQRDTRSSGAGNPIDTSSKDSGGFGSSIAGTRNQSVTVAGIIRWPDTALDKLRVHWADGTRPWCKLVMNEAGDHWFGQYAVTQFDGGGSNDSATEYSVTLQNAIRPSWIEAA